MTQAAFEGSLLVLLTWAALLSIRAGLFNVALEAKFAVGMFATLLAWRYCPAVLRNNLLLAGILGTLMAALLAGVVGHFYGWLTAKRHLDPIVSGVALNFSIIPLAAWASNVLYRSWERNAPGTNNLSRRLTELYSDQSSAALVISVVILVASAMFAWWIISTVTGTRLMASGLSSSAALEAGIDVNEIRARAARWSGYYCGLAGALYIYFISPSSFTADATIGRGFLALAVTLIARKSVFWVCCVAFLLGAVRTGSQTMLRRLLEGQGSESIVGFIAEAAPFFIILLIFVLQLLPRLSRYYRGNSKQHHYTA